MGHIRVIAQLHPEHRLLSKEKEIHADVVPRFRGKGQGLARPWVTVNMVSSVDGRAAVSGGAADLGSAADRTVMRTLRAKADAVMVGAGTLRAEKLSLGLDSVPFESQPLGVVVSSSPDGLPFRNLVSVGSQRILVITSAVPTNPTPPGLSFRRVPSAEGTGVDVESAVFSLKKEEGVEALLVEGGPSLNAALFSLGLVDELFVTLAPKLIGAGPIGSADAIVGGITAPNQALGLRLLSAFVAEHELFLRYAVDHDQ